MCRNFSKEIDLTNAQGSAKKIMVAKRKTKSDKDIDLPVKGSDIDLPVKGSDADSPKINTSPTIKSFHVDDLNPAPYNPRTIDDEAMAGLSESISTLGYLQHIVVNVRDGLNIILGGHQRYKVLRLEGVEYIDCVIVDVEEPLEKIINLSLNNREIEGNWDIDKLEVLLASAREHSEDLFEKLRLSNLEESLDLNSLDFDGFDEEDDDENEDFSGDELNSVEMEFLPEDFTLFLRIIEKEKITFKSPSKKVQYGLKLGQFLRKCEVEGLL